MDVAWPRVMMQWEGMWVKDRRDMALPVELLGLVGAVMHPEHRAGKEGGITGAAL